MNKKANAIFLVLAVAIALVSILVFTNMNFVEQGGELTKENADVVVDITLKNAIHKGVMQFLDHGFSNDESDAAAPVRGTSAWFCNQALPPGLEETTKSLQYWVKKEVDEAIIGYNNNYPDFTISWDGVIDVDDVNGGAADISTLPDDSFGLTLKNVKVETDDGNEVVSDMKDVPFTANWRIWDIYKQLRGWMDGQADQVTKKISDYMLSEECKIRLCDCGRADIYSFVDDLELDRDTIIQKIDDSIDVLKSGLPSGLTCDYTILKEKIDHIDIFNSGSLEMYAGAASPVQTESVRTESTDSPTEIKCASQPAKWICATSGGNDNTGPDNFADPAQRDNYGDAPTVGEYRDPELMPTPAKTTGNYGCPYSGAVLPEQDPRDPALVTTPPPNLAGVFTPASHTEVPRDDDVLAPRYDLYGMQRTVYLLLSINCQAEGEYFETEAGTKPIRSTSLMQISLREDCPPPLPTLINGNEGICATGECWLGGSSNNAGVQWFQQFGEPCVDDASCAAPGCLFCGDDDKCWLVNRNLLPNPGQCKICDNGALVTVSDDEAMGCAVCKTCQSGSCSFDSDQESDQCNTCGTCSAATDSCEPQPGFDNVHCGTCRTCGPLGQCDGPEPGVACGSECNPGTCSATDAGTCERPGPFPGSEKSCGCKTNCDGSTVCGTCDGAGNCNAPTVVDKCCPASGGTPYNPSTQECCGGVTIVSIGGCSSQAS